MVWCVLAEVLLRHGGEARIVCMRRCCVRLFPVVTMAKGRCWEGVFFTRVRLCLASHPCCLLSGVCDQPLQSTNAISHCDQAIRHCNQPLGLCAAEWLVAHCVLSKPHASCVSHDRTMWRACMHACMAPAPHPGAALRPGVHARPGPKRSWCCTSSWCMWPGLAYPCAVRACTQTAASHAHAHTTCNSSRRPVGLRPSMGPLPSPPPPPPEPAPDLMPTTHAGARPTHAAPGTVRASRANLPTAKPQEMPPHTHAHTW